jgi:hypothetical protein
LEQAFVNNPASTEWWLTLEVEPAFETLRADPRFKRLLAGVRAHIRNEQKALERLRSDGLIP